MAQMPVRMEVDDGGDHRIVAHGQKGEWFRYEHVSTLETPGGLLIAATAYYEGYLPIECVLSVQKVFDGGAGVVSVPGHRPE